MIRSNTLSSRWQRWYFRRPETHRLLFIAVSFGVSLLLARTLYTGNKPFLFLGWNLFLASLPYFLSYQLSKRPYCRASGWKLAVAFVVWLLFIPNSFYILTDLFHLHNGSRVPLWYDLLMIMTFAWNGLLMGVLSVRHMEKIVQRIWPGYQEAVFVYPVMGMSALGVYIGRYLRFNSWDVVSDPFRLLGDIGQLMAHPLLYKNAWGMITCYSVFLTLLYITLKRVGRAVI